MTDEIGVSEEVANPQSENAHTAEQNPIPEKQPDPGTKEYNWRALEAQNRELQHRIEGLERQKTISSKPEPVEDPWEGLDGEDYISVSQAKQIVDKTVEKVASKVVSQAISKRERDTEPERMAARYPDFDEVVSKYAIPILEKSRALQATLKNSPNPYQAAYDLGKSQKELMEKKPDNYSQKAKQNLEKPISGNSVSGQGTLSQAGSFSNLSREEVWKLSQKYANSA